MGTIRLQLGSISPKYFGWYTVGMNKKRCSQMGFKGIIALCAALGMVPISAGAEVARTTKYNLLSQQTTVVHRRIAPVIEAADLKAMMNVRDAQVIDIRAMDDTSAIGYIPGSVHVPIDAVQSIWRTQGGIPSDRIFTRFVRTAGLTQGAPVVIVHSGQHSRDFGSAALVYWTLKSVGFNNLTILNGGAEAWRAAGGAMADTATAPKPSGTVVRFVSKWLATRAHVDAVMVGDRRADLLQVEAVQAKPTPSIDKALRFSAKGLVDARGGKLVNERAVFMQIKQVDADWHFGDVITFSETSEYAAAGWFLASEIAGIDNVKVFADEMRTLLSMNDEGAIAPIF